MTAPAGPDPAEDTGRVRGLRRLQAASGRLRPIHLLLAVAVLAVASVAVLRAVVVDVYTVHQDSMHPTLEDGERMLVDRSVGEGEVARRDVVVFDGTGSFTPYEGDPGAVADAAARVGHWFGIGSPPQTYVKRVIGVGGDQVACCDSSGRLTVDDRPVDEAYLGREVTAGDPASETEFDVVVPEGRLWVMGDNRHASVDSRALLGAPGGGMISEDRVIGEAVEIFWPWSQRRTVAEGAAIPAIVSEARRDAPCR